MKITRRQLRRIIKEDLRRALLKEDVDITSDNLSQTVEDAPEGSMITYSRGFGEQDMFYRMPDGWTSQLLLSKDDVLAAVLPEFKEEIESQMDSNTRIEIPRAKVDSDLAPGSDDLSFAKSAKSTDHWVEVGEGSTEDIIPAVEYYLNAGLKVYLRDK